MDCAVFGAARDGVGAAAGSARRCAAGHAAGGIDAGNAVSSKQREQIRRGGCGGGAGARNLVGAAAVMDFEDSRDDGDFAQGISVDCGATELRGGILPCGSSVAADVGILRLIPKSENILNHSG